MANEGKFRANGIYSFAVDGDVLEWRFRDGSMFTLDRSACDEDTRREAEINGYRQSIGDAGALPAGTTATERRDAMRERRDRIAAGEWNAVPTGIPHNLARALAELFPRDIGDVATARKWVEKQAMVGKKTVKEMCAILVARPNVRDKMAEYIPAALVERGAELFADLE